MAKKTKKNKRSVKSEKIEYEVSSGNLFKDFGYENPEEAQVKSDLAILIRSIIKQKKLTQKKAADLIGIDQPKISKITRGILSEFTLERLMRFLVALGCDIEIKPLLGKASRASIHVARSNITRRISA